MVNYNYILAKDICLFFLQCLLLLSQMPEDITGKKSDDQRLHDAINFLLYLQVHAYIWTEFFIIVILNELEKDKEGYSSS